MAESPITCLLFKSSLAIRRSGVALVISLSKVGETKEPIRAFGGGTEGCDVIRLCQAEPDDSEHLKRSCTVTAKKSLFRIIMSFG